MAGPSSVVWTGKAAAVAQVDEFTPANPHVGTVYTLTVNGNAVSYTVTAADLVTGAGDEAAGVAAVCDGLVAALTTAKSDIPEFSDLTATDGTTKVTVTADTKGRPFTVSASVSSAGSSQSEVQSLTLSGASSGNITLTFDGQTTGNIAYNASAATIETALEALSNIGAGNVSCSGGALNSSAVTITFASSLANTNVATITANDVDLDAGTPTVSVTTQGAAGAATLGSSTTTAATGPSHWDATGNWSGGAIPANTNDVYLQDSDVDILYGLDQSSVTLATLTIKQSFTGTLGLSEIANEGESNAYNEYLDTFLQIGATNVEIGEGAGNGSSRIKLDFGSVQTTVNVVNSGTSATTRPAIMLTGTHASNSINISKGEVGLGVLGGQSTTWATITMAHQDNPTSDVSLTIGDSATLTTIAKHGGTLVTNSGFTTLENNAGDSTIESGTCTNIKSRGGSVYYNSDDTLTNGYASDEGVLDFSKDGRSKTVTNLYKYGKQSQIKDPNRVISSFDCDCIETDATGIDLGKNITVTRASL